MLSVRSEEVLLALFPRAIPVLHPGVILRNFRRSRSQAKYMIVYGWLSSSSILLRLRPLMSGGLLLHFSYSSHGCSGQWLEEGPSEFGLLDTQFESSPLQPPRIPQNFRWPYLPQNPYQAVAPIPSPTADAAVLP